MPAFRRVLVAIVHVRRVKALIIANLACGHQVVVRRQTHLQKRTRCDTCTKAQRLPQSPLWKTPRPFCACGCGQRVPPGRAKYIDRRHKALAERPRMSGHAAKAGKKGWSPGGANFERYKTRLRARLDAIVPKAELIPRGQVIVLLHRYGNLRYHTGFAAARMRFSRGMERPA